MCILKSDNLSWPSQYTEVVHVLANIKKIPELRLGDNASSLDEIGWD